MPLPPTATALPPCSLHLMSRPPVPWLQMVCISPKVHQRVSDLLIVTDGTGHV